jgi:DNA-directed RNA polymerase subunit RPC12/RpoP
MIEFACSSCGKLISVSESYRGRKGRCPSCKSIITVPKEQPPCPPELTGSDDGEAAPAAAFLDPAMFDIPPKQLPATESTGQAQPADKAFQQPVQPETDLATAQPALERKHPWLVDIFLYPANLAGLTVLGMVIGVPLLFHAFVWILGIFTLVFPPMLVFLTLFAVVGLIVRIVLYLYLYWYLCECVRDSAQGGARAPETMALTPGVGDMLLQLLKILACLVLFWGPVVAWAFRTFTMAMATVWYAGPLTPVFSSALAANLVITVLLLAYAIFFFPMALLAVVMFDSLSGLNPVVILRSILSTFLQYCVLVLVFCALSAFVAGLKLFVMRYCPLPMQITALLLYCLSAYLLVVKAHILGRFYWNNRQILDWET